MLTLPELGGGPDGKCFFLLLLLLLKFFLIMYTVLWDCATIYT